VPKVTRVDERLGWAEPVDLERSPYFPLDETGVRGVSSFIVDEWYPPHWKAMELPSLYAMAGNENVEIYRFVELPTWMATYAVTLELDPAKMSPQPFLPEPGVGGEEANAARSAWGSWARTDVGTIRYVLTNGSGGYHPGVIVARGEAAVPQHLAAEFRKLFDEADLWQERTEDLNLGRDGTTWVIESVRDGRYHVVERWTPVMSGQARVGTEAFVALVDWLRQEAVPRPLRVGGE
jgi:hypothetical protein